MIVPILLGRVGTPVVGARCGVVVVMLGRLLVVAILRPALRVEGRWAHSGQRKRDDDQSKRLPTVLTNARCPLYIYKG